MSFSACHIFVYMLIEVLGSLRFWFSGDGLEMVALRARGSAQIQDHYHTSRFTQTPSTVIQLLQHQFRFFGRANGARRCWFLLLVAWQGPLFGALSGLSVCCCRRARLWVWPPGGAPCLRRVVVLGRVPMGHFGRMPVAWP